jgi:hypothetical protein
MSKRRDRQLRATQRLAHAAHASVHLLLNLSGALTEASVAAMCRESANELAAALLETVPPALTHHAESALTAESRVKPVLSGQQQQSRPEKRYG